MLSRRILSVPRVLGALRVRPTLVPLGSGLRSSLFTTPHLLGVRGLATRGRPTTKRAASKKRTVSASSRRARPRSSSRARSATSRARSATARRAAKKRTAAERAKTAKANAKRQRLEERRERRAEKHAETIARRAARRATLRDQREARREREKEHKAGVRERAMARRHLKKEHDASEQMFKRLRVQASNRGDPAKPSRPLSAYMLYHRSVFPSVFAEAQKVHGNKAAREATKTIGAQWKALAADAKAPFEAQAKEAKDKQQTALKAYNDTIPKQPLTAYMLFAKEKNAEFMAAVASEGVAKSAREKVAATGKRTAAAWKALPESAKAKYVEAYRAEASKFEAVKEKFIESQLAMLPADYRHLVRARLPGRVSEVPAWVARVNELLRRETEGAAAKA